jgi:hypothetical protein
VAGGLRAVRPPGPGRARSRGPGRPRRRAWWTCRVDEAIAARRQAHAGYLRAGDARRAGHAAWLLYYDHLYRGEETVAGGWLRRARRHLTAEPDCPEQGYLAFAEAELALWAGRLDEAVELAERTTALGQRLGSPDLLVLGLETPQAFPRPLQPGRISRRIA